MHTSRLSPGNCRGLGVMAFMALVSVTCCPTWADRITLDDNRFRSGYEDVLSLVQPGDLQSQGHQTVLQGRVRQVIRGLRQGDPLDPAQHDRLVIETGVSGAGPTVVISAFYVHSVDSMVDTSEDFSWLFSNRHDLAGLAPGSDAHRQIIFALVDPDGWLGLSTGGAPAQAGTVEEGIYTQYLLHGQPDDAQVMAAARWQDAPPFRLPQVTHQAAAGESASLLEQPFSYYMDRLLAAAVQAERYPGYTPEFGQWALDSLDLLCRLRIADPALADGADAILAERARNLGAGCYEFLVSVLWGLDATYIQQMYPHHAFSADEARSAVLDLLEGSETFRNVILREPVEMFAPMDLDVTVPDIVNIPGISLPGDVSEPEPPWSGETAVADEDFQLVVEARQMITLLTDLAAVAEGRDELADRAGAIVQSWLGQGRPDDNSRYWREVLWTYRGAYHLADPAQYRQVSLRFLCEAGWSLPVDMAPRIERLTALAEQNAIVDPARTQTALAFLAILRATAGQQGDYGEQLAGWVDEQFREEPRCCEPEQAAWSMWKSIESSRYECASLASLDLKSLLAD